jgi:hypothetical protein
MNDMAGESDNASREPCILRPVLHRDNRLSDPNAVHLSHPIDAIPTDAIRQAMAVERRSTSWRAQQQQQQSHAWAADKRGRDKTRTETLL